jgi:hypothetical protein
MHLHNEDKSFPTKILIGIQNAADDINAFEFSKKSIESVIPDHDPVDIK